MSLYVNRLPPAMPVGAYQTYGYSRRRDTVIKAACQQVGCEAYRKGWDSIIDESTDLGRSQAAYIRTQSGRDFRELKSVEGLTIFRFEPGQRCFTDHQTVAESFYVRKGDWRENRGLIRKHVNGLDWAEDMQENLDRVRTAQERG